MIDFQRALLNTGNRTLRTNRSMVSLGGGGTLMGQGCVGQGWRNVYLYF